MILSHLEPHLTASLVSRLDEDVQVEVAERIATLNHIRPDVVKRVEETLGRKIGMMASPEHDRVGGVDAAAAMLNLSAHGVETHVIHALQERNPQLAKNIMAQMFVFEDIVLLEDSTLRIVLMNAQRQDVLVALKAADRRTHDRLIAIMEESEQDRFREDCQNLEPLGLGEVEAAQRRIIAVIEGVRGVRRDRGSPEE